MTNQATPKCTQSVHPFPGMKNSDADVISILTLLHAGNRCVAPMSWREIASKMPLFNQINHATLSAYANERRPITNKRHRRILGLPYTIETAPCPDCGEAPTVCLCDGCQVVNPEEYTIKRKATPKRKRAPRIAVRKDDPASAAKSLSNNLSPKVLTEVVRLLCQDHGLEMEY